MRAKDKGTYSLTSPLYSSRIRKLWEEVRTRYFDMRNPAPLASGELSLFLANFYLDFIHPIELNGKVNSCLELTLFLRSFFPRMT